MTDYYDILYTHKWSHSQKSSFYFNFLA